MKIELQGQAETAYRQLAIKNKQLAKRISNKLIMLSEKISIGKPLKGKLKGSHSLRVGDYRILYDVIEDTILVWKIQHRRDVYR